MRSRWSRPRRPGTPAHCPQDTEVSAGGGPGVGSSVVDPAPRGLVAAWGGSPAHPPAGLEAVHAPPPSHPRLGRRGRVAGIPRGAGRGRSSGSHPNSPRRGVTTPEWRGPCREGGQARWEETRPARGRPAPRPAGLLHVPTWRGGPAGHAVPRPGVQARWADGQARCPGGPPGHPACRHLPRGPAVRCAQHGTRTYPLPLLQAGCGRRWLTANPTAHGVGGPSPA